MKVVLAGFILALLSNRDGNLSSIHRFMKNKHAEILSSMGLPYTACVSRSHLPILLASVNYQALERFVFEEHGVELPELAKNWFAIDGKELKGSILPGNTRGLTAVQVVRHSERREVIAQNYFSGRKSSEVEAVRDLLRYEVLAGKNITLDALHLKADTLEIISKEENAYVVGLKLNQKELYEDMEQVPKYQKPIQYHKTVDVHGGRVDTREYNAYNVENEYFDKRWKNSSFATLIVVKRERFFKTPQKRRNKGKIEFVQQEISTNYFLSNKKVNNEAEARELFEAIRGHWNVEVNNHIRDVTLKEDKLKTKSEPLTENIALLRTLVVKMISRSLAVNFAALLDDFADSFNKLVLFINDTYQT